ncbi:hypothetical protein QOT17_000247 [Balamuthia mandrillaris]
MERTVTSELWTDDVVERRTPGGRALRVEWVPLDRIPLQEGTNENSENRFCNTNNHHEQCPPSWRPVGGPRYRALYEKTSDSYNYDRWYGNIELGACVLALSPKQTIALAEACRSSLITGKPPQQLQEELDEIAALIDQEVMAKKQESCGYFAKLDACSMKDSVVAGGGLKEYTRGKDVVEAIVASKRCARRLFVARDALLKIFDEENEAQSEEVDTKKVEEKENLEESFGECDLFGYHPEEETTARDEKDKEEKENNQELKERRNTTLHEEECVKLIFCRWKREMDKMGEFRCFVKRQKVVAISQYCWFREGGGWWQRRSCLPEVAESILWLWEELKKHADLPFKDCIMDVYVAEANKKEQEEQPDPEQEHRRRKAKGKIRYAKWKAELVEFNPFGAHLGGGSALFHWLNDWNILHGLPPTSSSSDSALYEDDDDITAQTVQAENEAQEDPTLVLRRGELTSLAFEHASAAILGSLEFIRVVMSTQEEISS